MAISGNDGSIILTTSIDTSGINKGTRSIKSEVASLDAQYKKLGLSQSDAFKKAGSEIDRTEEKTEKLGKTSKTTAKTMQDGAKSASSAFKKLSAVVAAVVATVVATTVNFGKEASQTAMQTESAVLRLVDIYGNAGKAVANFIDLNAKALGMSKSSASSFSAVYGNLFSVWADQATNAKLTNKYLSMTAVVASKTGRTMEDVQERIRSGLLGNTEAVEDLGIFVNVKTIEMTEAFKRIANGKSWEQLSAYEQSQVRTLAILEQATQKYGNTVANTTSLSQAKFGAAFEDLKATAGAFINRYLAPILQYISVLIEKFDQFLQRVFKVSGSVNESLDKQSELIDDSIKKQDDLTESVEQTAKATKKALAGFDEIQVLTGETADAAVAGGGSPVNLDDYLTGADIVYNVEAEGGEEFLAKMQEISNELMAVFEPLRVLLQGLWPTFGESLEWVWTEILEPFKTWIVEELSPAISDSFTEAIEHFKEAWATIEDPVMEFWENVLKPAIDKIKEWILQVVDNISKIFNKLSEKFKDNEEEINAIVTVIVRILEIIWTVLSNLIDSIMDSAWPVISTTIDVIMGIISFIGNLFLSIYNFFAGVIELFKGNTDKAKEYFVKFLKNVGNMFVGLANAIIGVINNLWSLIFNAFKGIVNAIGGIIETIGGWFGADWDLHWDAEVPLIPEIPKLAQGSVLPGGKPFLAVVNDQPAGQTNVEAPLDTIKQALIEALAQNGGGQDNRPIVIQIDGREIARAVRSGDESLGNQTVYGGFANVY